MTQEDKQLLLKDLCARLPYDVMIKDTSSGHYGRLVEIGRKFAYFVSKLNSNVLDTLLWNVKPYLRPMSSMTRKERQFLLKFGTVGMDENDKVFDAYTFGLERTMIVIDFLNIHHFDYRGLIPMGLALEAKEDMYKAE